MSQIENIIISILQKNIEMLKSVYIFGSRAKQLNTKNSDIDIAFLSETSIDNIRRYELAQILASELKKDVDLIDLNRASDVMKMQVVSEGKKLYGDDDLSFEESVYYKYIDLCELRSGIMHDIKARGSIYG